jgi:hypothetical protein
MYYNRPSRSFVVMKSKLSSNLCERVDGLSRSKLKGGDHPLGLFVTKRYLEQTG